MSNRGLGYARALVMGVFWIALGFGCAEGLPGPEGMVAGFIGAPPTGGTAAPGTAGSPGGAGMGSGYVPPPVFSGEACNQGDSEPCTCEDGVSAGTKVCRFERTSPTMGAYSMCEGCEAPAEPEAGTDGGSGTGASGMGASGTGASGTGGGASGTGASGTGASGTGASGTGASGTGASGTGGTSGGAGEPARGCDPDDCDDPLFGSACCTDDDECGVRLLISCNAR
jgi:PPE-repeat protein